MRGLIFTFQGLARMGGCVCPQILMESCAHSVNFLFPFWGPGIRSKHNGTAGEVQIPNVLAGEEGSAVLQRVGDRVVPMAKGEENNQGSRRRS